MKMDNDVGVTAAMIAAGADVIWDRFCVAARFPRDFEDYVDCIAEDVYRAMHAARPTEGKST